MFQFISGRRQSGCRGFTLIELLVVIAIIAILAAILFPVFAKARKAAQKSRCVSNLKQIGIAINMYQTDWGQRFPLASGFAAEANLETLFALPWNPRGLTDLRYMPELLAPYVKSVRIFICPSVGEDGQWVLPGGPGGIVYFASNRAPDNITTGVIGIPTTYIYNNATYRLDGSTRLNIGGQSEEIVLAPADAITVWDAVSGFVASGGTEAQIAHDNLINVLYVDGHAGQIKVKQDAAPWTNSHVWAVGALGFPKAGWPAGVYIYGNMGYAWDPNP